jgi:hypothetical protein
MRPTKSQEVIGMTAKPETVLESLMPADTPAYMAPAWLGCMHWAIGDADVIQAFRDETGNYWTPAKNNLDAMIDQATNADRAFVEAFIRWANVNVWGPIDG